MKTSRSASPTATRLSYIVRDSAIHGTGVFARRRIAAGERIVEYRGERIDWATALERSAAKGGPLNHTFFFTLADGRVIDGGSRGNAARFINHSCEPNCEAMEHEDGRVHIYALRDIDRGEELSYNYALIYDGRHTAAVRKAFACRCGAPSCSGVMLAPKRRRRALSA
ncbi:MAG TPA: SET domain-containing protein-lysine N-methyltransferase [Noviherbaspirillum sp.]|jgi:SET domain-containing protein|uniref:SET domain-containing protein n=1 Tax=Noviherbaspirillum sp. TaxID=1926288 RepID=UPI002F9341E5